MADPQDFTTVHLKDGTTVHLKGRLSPDEIGPQLAAFEKARQPQQAPQTQDTPPSLEAKIGSYIPEALTGPLALAQKYAVDPFEKAVAWGSYYAKRSVEPIRVPGEDNQPGWHIAPEGTLAQQHPILSGIEKGIAGVVGGTVTDPRNWPFFASSFARPILQRAISTGFAAQLGVGSLQGIKHLHDNWDNMSPAERAETITSSGLSGLFAAASAFHAQSLKGKPAQKPWETPVTGTGKTETEVKAESKPTATIPSQTTGSGEPPKLTYEQIKQRIADVEAKLGKKAIPPPGPTAKTRAASDAAFQKNYPPETMKELSPMEKDLWQQSAFGQKPMEDPGAKVRAANPEPTRAEVKAAADRAEAKAKPVEASDSPERAAKIRQILDDAYQIKEKPAKGFKPRPVADQVFQRMKEMRGAGMAEPDQVFTLMKEFPDNASEIAKAFSPEVGREAAPPEAPKPTPKPVPSTQEKPGRSEPVRAAEVAKVTEKPASRTLTDEQVQAHLQNIADWETKLTKQKKGEAKLKAEQPPAQAPVVKPLADSKLDFVEEPSLRQKQLRQKLAIEKEASQKLSQAPEAAGAEPRSQRGINDQVMQGVPRAEAEKQASGKIDFTKRMEIAKQRVEAAMADPKNKGVPKSEIQRRVAEQMKNELGNLGGSKPEDIRKRREAKIEGWLNQIRDSKSPESVYTTAYKMLKAYGLSDDEIIRRVSGAEGFAKTPNQYTGSDREQAPIEERLSPNPELDRKADELMGKKPLHGPFGELTHTPLLNSPKEAEAEALRRFGNEPFDIKSEKDSYGNQKWYGVRRDFKEPPRGQRGQLSDKNRELFGLPIDERVANAKKAKVDEALKGTEEATFKDFLRKPFGELSDAERKALREELDNAIREDYKRKHPGERGAVTLAALNPVARLADALDRVANFFERKGLSKQEFDNAQHAKNIIREVASMRARSHLEVMKALEDAIKRHDNPTNERQNFIDFMDAGEGKPGSQFLNPQDQALASELHSMFEERWDKIKAVKGIEGEGIENYLRHIWERPNKASKVLGGMLFGKRPLAGSGGFLRNRFYEYASEGIRHGLTPVSWNPVRLQLAALFDIDRFLAAHDIKDRYKDAGLVQWYKVGQYGSVPPGWQRIDDKIFSPRSMHFENDKPIGLLERGQYYAPHEVARVFNNYLSPGLGQNPVFRNFRNYNNALNMWQLGVSGYHGTMISLVSATSDLALGMQKIFNVGDFKGGLKDMFRGTLGTFILRSAAADYKLGKTIQSEAVAPTGNPVLGAYVDLLMKGGGRFQQDAWYTQGISQRKGFVNWLRLAKEGKLYEFATTPVRTFSTPIMEKFVPRVKIGVAARMMESKLDFMLKQGVTDPNAVATELGKIWDSVDNRAGQMVYDNLFWNKAAKDLSFLAVRAVGWDLGSLREYGGGALIDTPRQLANVLHGKRPELTARMAFTIATPITIGLFGGMMHYLMTGKAPQKSEDYFFPGPEGNKVSFPSYMKDFYAFKQHPMKTVVNKLSPTWSQISDLYSDTDFYGTEIYRPGDPLAKKGLDVLKWYASNWEGFSSKGIRKRVERGEATGPAALTGLFGFQPASPYVNLSSAGELANDLASREWKRGPRIAGDAERHQLIQKFEQQVGEGKLNMQELAQAWRDRKIQDADIGRIYSDYQVPKIERDFKTLALPDALAVMREANPTERVQLKPLLLEKYKTLERYPVEAQAEYDKQIRSYLQ